MEVGGEEREEFMWIIRFLAGCVCWDCIKQDTGREVEVRVKEVS